MFLPDSSNILIYVVSYSHTIVPYFNLFVFIKPSFSCFDRRDILQFIMIDLVSLLSAFDLFTIFKQRQKKKKKKNKEEEEMNRKE